MTSQVPVPRLNAVEFADSNRHTCTSDMQHLSACIIWLVHTGSYIVSILDGTTGEKCKCMYIPMFTVHFKKVSAVFVLLHTSQDSLQEISATCGAATYSGLQVLPQLLLHKHVLCLNNK